MNEVVQFLIEQGYVILFCGSFLSSSVFPFQLLNAVCSRGIGRHRKIKFPPCFGLSLLAALLSDQFWYQIGFRRGGKYYPSSVASL